MSDPTDAEKAKALAEAKALEADKKAKREAFVKETMEKQQSIELREAKTTAAEEALKVKELEIAKRLEEISARERKGLLAKLGVQDDEEAKKFEGKSNEILKELVEYLPHIKATSGGIPKSATQPVADEVIKTSDGLQIRQRVKDSNGKWVEV